MPITEVDTALELDGVHKQFAGVTAIRSLAFSVDRGAIFGIMGPNGAGKSTLINILSGFVFPDTGSVRMFGEDVTGLRSQQLAEIGVGRTFQNVRLFPGLTVLQTVLAGLHRHRRSSFSSAIAGSRSERRNAAERAREVLERVGVAASEKAIATELSYGEQRRVEIARALAGSPRLLLLDEPTAGMNDREAEAIAQLVRTIRDHGVTVILVEHNIRLILEHCTRAAVLNFGELLAVGDPRECIENPDVREAYFGRQSDSGRIDTLLRLRRDPSGERGQPPNR
jgi:branched-chain amino acid transport system ATP-binding protein